MKQNTLIFKVFLCVAILITLFHFLFHPIRIFGWQTSLFYLDERFSFGAYFTTVTVFLTSFFAFVNTLVSPKRRDKILSGALAAFFFLLSFDEYFEVHEYMREVLNGALTPGTLIEVFTRASWVFPFLLVIAVVFALLLYSVFTEKNRKVRNLFVIGICLYAAVLVLEVCGGMLYGQPIYLAFVGFEEGFEMVAAAVFLYAVLEKSLVYK